MSRRSFSRVAAALAASALLITFATVLAGPQEKGGARPLAPPITKPNKQATEKDKGNRLPPAGVDEAEARAILDKVIDEFDLKPRTQPVIPDDPPPHEGALIDIPYIVEPPDMLIVEVLEALPGRPISGERLIRPDGTINLGFYGEVHVRGLTLPQVKIAIIKHLRKYLGDDILLLTTLEDEEAAPPEPRPRPLPDVPDAKEGPFNDLEKGKPASPPGKPRASLGPRTLRGASWAARNRARAGRPVRTTGMPQLPDERKAAGNPPDSIVMPFPGQGQVKITIDVQGQHPEIVVPNAPIGAENPPSEFDLGMPGKVKVMPPLESGGVFVDVTAYNSKNYYILGDVLIPGRLPQTGNETVLDVLQFAGGLIATAEPKDIRLVRPGRDGKPARVYKVDLEAIQAKGDVRTNYQIFPGDRLVVGRNEVVKRTVELDRLQAPIQTVLSSILQQGTMLKSLGVLKPDQGDEVLKDLVDFWAKELSRKGDLKFDEQTLRDVLMRQLKRAPAAPRPGPGPGAR